MGHLGDRYDCRDAESMRRRLPKCYGTAAYEDCPGRCPHREWCQLDYANGHGFKAGDGDADAA